MLFPYFNHLNLTHHYLQRKLLKTPTKGLSKDRPLDDRGRPVAVLTEIDFWERHRDCPVEIISMKFKDLFKVSLVSILVFHK
jgi:hypothetical protein